MEDSKVYQYKLRSELQFYGTKSQIRVLQLCLQHNALELSGACSS